MNGQHQTPEHAEHALRTMHMPLAFKSKRATASGATQLAGRGVNLTLSSICVGCTALEAESRPPAASPLLNFGSTGHCKVELLPGEAKLKGAGKVWDSHGRSFGEQWEFFGMDHGRC